MKNFDIDGILAQANSKLTGEKTLVSDVFREEKKAVADIDLGSAIEKYAENYVDAFFDKAHKTESKLDGIDATVYTREARHEKVLASLSSQKRTALRAIANEMLKIADKADCSGLYDDAAALRATASQMVIGSLKKTADQLELPFTDTAPKSGVGGMATGIVGAAVGGAAGQKAVEMLGGGEKAQALVAGLGSIVGGLTAEQIYQKALSANPGFEAKTIARKIAEKFASAAPAVKAVVAPVLAKAVAAAARIPGPMQVKLAVALGVIAVAVAYAGSRYLGSVSVDSLPEGYGATIEMINDKLQAAAAESTTAEQKVILLRQAEGMTNVLLNKVTDITPEEKQAVQGLSVLLRDFRNANKQELSEAAVVLDSKPDVVSTESLKYLFAAHEQLVEFIKYLQSFDPEDQEAISEVVASVGSDKLLRGVKANAEKAKRNSKVAEAIALRFSQFAENMGISPEEYTKQILLKTQSKIADAKQTIAQAVTEPSNLLTEQDVKEVDTIEDPLN